MITTESLQNLQWRMAQALGVGSCFLTGNPFPKAVLHAWPKGYSKEFACWAPVSLWDGSGTLPARWIKFKRWLVGCPHC